MNAAEEIDALIAKNADWRGDMLAHLRATILATDPAIVETWKWMGSPVWELGGNKRRAIDFFEGDQMTPESLQSLIRSAVAHIQGRAKI